MPRTPPGTRDGSETVGGIAIGEALTRPALAADTPAAWLASHLAALFSHDDHDDDTDEPAWVEAGWRTVDDLVADDAAALRALHGRLVADGTPPKTAATYLAGWTGGIIAEAVGFALATAGAGFVLDADRLAVHQHREGWLDGLDPGEPPAVLVVAGHPWAGQPGVEVVDTAETLVSRTVDALVTACAPLVDACRSLAAVGRAGLWNEVGDGLGTAAVTWVDGLVATEAMFAVLHAAARAPAAPWKARPSLRFAHSETLGPVPVAQKGGCCLAYLKERPEPEPDDLDEDARAYRERFPRAPGAPRYCSTCSLLDPGDCAARQIFWRERRAATT